MVRRVRFSLKLKDDQVVRNIEQLRDNFDIAAIMRYFLNGKLQIWLEDHHYDDEAAAVAALQPEQPNLQQRLCRIFAVPYESEAADPVDINNLREKEGKLERLKQLTADKTILKQVNHVAFDQSDLDRILKAGVKNIYLYDGTYTIPLKEKDHKYIGLGKVEVSFTPKTHVDLEENGIDLKNVRYDKEDEKIIHQKRDLSEEIYRFSIKHPFVRIKTDETEQQFSWLEKIDIDKPKKYHFLGSFNPSIKTGDIIGLLLSRDNRSNSSDDDLCCIVFTQDELLYYHEAYKDVDLFRVRYGQIKGLSNSFDSQLYITYENSHKEKGEQGVLEKRLFCWNLDFQNIASFIRLVAGLSENQTSNSKDMPK